MSIPVKDLTQDSALFSRFIQRIVTMDDSVTRWYLGRILQNLPEKLRFSGAEYLIQSSRIIDKHTAVYTFLSVEDVGQKAALLKPWLSKYTEQNDLVPILNTIRNDQDVIESALLNESLAKIWRNNEDDLLKAYALRIIKPSDPTDEEIFKLVTRLLTKDSNTQVYMTISAMADWLNSFSGVFSVPQMKQLIDQLDAISFDRRYDYDTRFLAIDTIQTLINIVESKRLNALEEADANS